VPNPEGIRFQAVSLPRALGIRTLVPAKSDRLDFHEVGVESLRDALRMAYQAGRMSGTPNANQCPLCRGGGPARAWCLLVGRLVNRPSGGVAGIVLIDGR